MLSVRNGRISSPRGDGNVAADVKFCFMMIVASHPLAGTETPPRCIYRIFHIRRISSPSRGRKLIDKAGNHAGIFVSHLIPSRGTETRHPLPSSQRATGRTSSPHGDRNTVTSALTFRAFKSHLIPSRGRKRFLVRSITLHAVVAPHPLTGTKNASSFSGWG